MLQDIQPRMSCQHSKNIRILNTMTNCYFSRWALERHLFISYVPRLEALGRATIAFCVGGSVMVEVWQSCEVTGIC
jgi:hypothetical protein